MAQCPKVSVCMICFNQAEFISQAIESVLDQRTSFDFEIVVGDDCSTDGTTQIIQGFSQRFPDKVKLLSRPYNLGMNRNLRETLESCTGEYIAILEGDDYWTDSTKLQLQADYLDHNPECALCHHSVIHLAWPSGRILKDFPPARYRRERPPLRELARFNFIQTCAAMLRRSRLPRLDEQFQTLKLGDWPLFALMSEEGCIGYLDRPMAHYRIHPNNTWNRQSANHKLRATECMAWYLRTRVSHRSKHLWEDTLLALAFKDILLAIRALEPLSAFRKLFQFTRRCFEFRKPFWIFIRLWGYYRSYSV